MYIPIFRPNAFCPQYTVYSRIVRINRIEIKDFKFFDEMIQNSK